MVLRWCVIIIIKTLNRNDLRAIRKMRSLQYYRILQFTTFVRRVSCEIIFQPYNTQKYDTFI